jgi:hypothetical protein
LRENFVEGLRDVDSSFLERGDVHDLWNRDHVERHADELTVHVIEVAGALRNGRSRPVLVREVDELARFRIETERVRVPGTRRAVHHVRGIVGLEHGSERLGVLGVRDLDDLDGDVLRVRLVEAIYYRGVRLRLARLGLDREPDGDRPTPVVARAATGDCERAGEGYRGERGAADPPAGSVLCHEGDLRLPDFLVRCPQTRAGFPIVSSAVPGSHRSRDALTSRHVAELSSSSRATPRRCVVHSI